MNVTIPEIVGYCEMCGRKDLIITAHHLIPKTTHSSKFVKKNFNSNEMDSTIDLCKACHRTVHATYTEKELAKSYSTLKSLIESDAISRFIKWVRKQSSEKKIKVNWTNDRREKNGSKKYR